MLILLSPSKALDFTEPAQSNLKATKPLFGRDTAELVERMRQAGRDDLKRLMDLSDALADLNRARYLAFEQASERAAVLAFDGDVYSGLDARSLSDHDLDFAQQHLRILSGLYGLLRPLDAIRPYRLEMGVRLDTARGRDLYAFWGAKLAQTVDAHLRGHAAKVVVNLASDEYFRAVDPKALKAPVVTPVFKEVRNGAPRALFMFLKRARGRMARFALQRRITSPEDLKAFDEDGYRFDPALSDASTWTFTRPQPPSPGKARRSV